MGFSPIFFSNKPNDFQTDIHGWTEFLPQRKTAPSLTGEHRVPWIVVGAGITGLSAARRLAKTNPEQDIILVDAREVGQGASGRNSGYAVKYSQFPGAYDAEKIEEYRRVNRINEAGLSLLRADVFDNDIECSWHEDGFHHLASDEMAIRECDYFQDYLDGLEIPHISLSQDALTERLGSSLYKRGFHVPEGALLQPAALVRGLADSLPNNVTLYESSPVLKMSYGVQTTLQFSEGRVVADKVILATNYEAPKLGFLNRYVIGSTLSGSFTRVLNTEELANLGTLCQWGILSLHGGGATVRITEDGRICLRNTAEYNGARLLSDQQLLERQSIHREAFERRFPQLKNVPFEYAWSGVEGISRNGTNFFGRQRKNVFFAGGYNGSGVSRGTAFGAALADYANGGQSELINDCLNSTPATWMPPRPFLDIGAAFTVRSRFKGVGLDR
ncbi:FAD-binding oxidoreductase [Granulosicoccus sp.]|nr:FAD-binding oxidoreductase [Granulosicoccus sp.]MDB4222884.1 FAD-binding oxidoreductase [Granulosicoccus sp.]